MVSPFTDIIFTFELRSWTLCAQWTYHMIPARLLVHFPSVSHVLSLCTCMFPFLFHMFSYFPVLDCRLVYAYRSVLRLLLLSRRLVCRLVIPGLMTRLLLTSVCTCISQSIIYMVEDGDLFPIFNLLFNHPTSVTCEIPRTLPRPF